MLEVFEKEIAVLFVKMGTTPKPEQRSKLL